MEIKIGKCFAVINKELVLVVPEEEAAKLMKISWGTLINYRTRKQFNGIYKDLVYGRLFDKHVVYSLDSVKLVCKKKGVS